MRKLLIAVVVLAVLLVTADRVAVAVAENQVSSKVAAAYSLPSRPQVSIQGFPFLTQALSGDYSEIDISVAGVQADGATLTDLKARFTGVHAPLSEVLGGRATTVTADHARGSAIVGFAAVSRRLPLQHVSLAADGRYLKVSGTLVYQGNRVPLSAVVGLSVASGGIRVTPRSLHLPGSLGSLSSQVSGRFGFVLPLQALPLHLRLTSVAVTPAGLRIGVAARNVHFARA